VLRSAGVFGGHGRRLWCSHVPCVSCLRGHGVIDIVS
jgi:hypothetical protein